MPRNISVIIITKNEADRIARCIQSVLSLSDDVIVVDSGSDDETVSIAKELGAIVHETKWKGFGRTKNFGHTLAQHDWILSLDADEYVSEELLEELQKLTVDDECVYGINRQNLYFGKVINHSGWNPDWVVRLFNRKKIQWNDNLVHEKLKIPEETKIVRLNGRLIHESYRSLEDHKTKIESYAHLRAKIWHANNTTPGFWKSFFGPFWKGFKSYILKLGFLDGKEGWTIARMNSYLVKRQLYHYNKLKPKTP